MWIFTEISKTYEHVSISRTFQLASLSYLECFKKVSILIYQQFKMGIKLSIKMLQCIEKTIVFTFGVKFRPDLKWHQPPHKNICSALRLWCSFKHTKKR